MLAKDLQFQVFKSVDGPEGYISPQSILVFNPFPWWQTLLVGPTKDWHWLREVFMTLLWSNIDLIRLLSERRLLNYNYTCLIWHHVTNPCPVHRGSQKGFTWEWLHSNHSYNGLPSSPTAGSNLLRHSAAAACNVSSRCSSSWLLSLKAATTKQQQPVTWAAESPGRLLQHSTACSQSSNKVHRSKQQQQGGPANQARSSDNTKTFKIKLLNKLISSLWAPSLSFGLS